MRQALSLTDEQAARWQVMPYISNMGEALAAADLVVSRAGASSIAEIAALAAPSILVPYPHATTTRPPTPTTSWTPVPPCWCQTPSWTARPSRLR